MVLKQPRSIFMSCSLSVSRLSESRKSGASARYYYALCGDQDPTLLDRVRSLGGLNWCDVIEPRRWSPERTSGVQ
ncbi:hypothetical protein M407DRAFT_199530 [Tulasnella calospora MUT 4182]|uniref:Uncharacterized protein n=1 Tax=Tulasnella calospora MUT 4182 TaxID=1051891 RepID=A0A0C3QIG3_9AGAM|nr:hypothetical protein M407DRAFT_199530 [Tulasnella calospora MUT 4182]